MRHPPVIGLDVGGAHLKVARADAGGRCAVAREVACPLWRGLDRLDAALVEGLAGLPPGEPVALTMTAELADLFPDRDAGVAAILDALAPALAWRPGGLVFAGAAGFLRPEAARDRPRLVASMNWLASAGLVARSVPDALFVDVGSTTADLVPIRDGAPRPAALTDAGRLGAGELAYTGLTRTPLMAVADRAPVAGAWRPVPAEFFATTADVWRLLGELDEGLDLHPAADGGPKTREGSARRLARSVGADLGDAPAEAWVRLARWFADRQLLRVEEALALLLSRDPAFPDGAPVVAAGAGLPIVRRLAARAGRPYAEAAALVPTAAGPDGPVTAGAVAAAFPAVAVALLAQGELAAARSA